MISGKTKTINPISKFIQDCPEEDMNDLQRVILGAVKSKMLEDQDHISYMWYCGAQIVLHKFYELKPEMFNDNSAPKSSLEEMVLGRDQWLNQKLDEWRNPKGSGFLFYDLKGVLFGITMILVFIAFVVFLFTGPSDPLQCRIIDGQKFCKYESEWEKIEDNLLESIKKIP